MLVVAASPIAGVELAVGASSSSSLSGFVIWNGTLVNTPPGISIYSPWLSPLVSFVGAEFLL